MLLTVSRERGWRVEQSWDEHIDANGSADGDPGVEGGVKDRLNDGFPESWGVVRRLEANWRRFVRGRHKKIAKSTRKDSKWDGWGDSDSNSEE